MAFNWESLLRRQHVDYVTSGSNISAGQIGVRCPYCGSADPSYHMGISLSGQGWFCQRCRRGGKSRSYLIKLLLKCTDEEARKLAGYDDVSQVPGDDDLRRMLRSLRGDGSEEKLMESPLTMPPEFRPLLLSLSPMARSVQNYLRGRGYDGAELEWVVREYDLRYCILGQFAWRMIIPVRDRYGVLVTWTGRSVRPDDDVRYRTLSTRPEKASYGRVARGATSGTLLGLSLLWAAPEPRALVVCEGPMDAIRVSLYGHTMGVYGTCLFGLNVSDLQLGELELLAERFPRIYLCIDSGEELRRSGLLGKMSTFRTKTLMLPDGVKDPGELSPSQAVDLCIQAIS